MNSPIHTSYSARETLKRCAKSYFLRYLTDAPKRPALWSIGGSAVHSCTEDYDRAVHAGRPERFVLSDSWQAHFGGEVRRAREQEPNENKWRRSPSEPVETWNSLGPQLVQSYIAWRERSPWKLWVTPDGDPAIELDVSGLLPGCPIEIKAYLDRVFYDPVFNRLHIVDLKSGRRSPTTPDQFRTYRSLLEVKHGVIAPSGTFFMNRLGTPGRSFDVSGDTPQIVGAIYGEAWAQIQDHLKSGEWPADTSDCFLCDVSDACAAKGGPLAAQYDPDHPGYAERGKGITNA